MQGRSGVCERVRWRRRFGVPGTAAARARSHADSTPRVYELAPGPHRIRDRGSAERLTIRMHDHRERPSRVRKSPRPSLKEHANVQPGTRCIRRRRAVLAWRIDRLGAAAFPTRHADSVYARQLRRARATRREAHEPTDDQLALWRRVTASTCRPRSRASSAGQTMRAPLLHTVWRAVSQRDERR